MARRKTLIKLLNDLRAECRLSLNPAHNTQARDAQVAMLQRWQEWLWGDFDWPHLRVERLVPVEAGQRIYDLPEDLDIDRVEKIEFRDGSEWCKLHPGIDAGHYAAHDSEIGERSWPVARWRIWEDEQIEVWPVPDHNADPGTKDGYLKITGIRKLRPLVVDTDKADLDDRLIVLNAAGELLAAGGSKDAQLKIQQAQKRYLKLRSGLMPRRQFRMFGGEGNGRELRGPPRVHYRIVSKP